MEISGASLIVERLAQQTKYVFLVPGKSIDPLVQAIAHSDRLTGILATTELGSGYMADGYARAAGKLGVCLSTGGPGASNLLTAAINARLETSNVLFLTGDVPATCKGQGYFHDSSNTGTRSVELFQQALAYSSAIDRPSDLLQELDVALINTPAHLAIGSDLHTHFDQIATLIDRQLDDCLINVVAATAAISVTEQEPLCREMSVAYSGVESRSSSSNVTNNVLGNRLLTPTCNNFLAVELSNDGTANSDSSWDETTAVAVVAGSRNQPIVGLTAQCDRILNVCPRIIVLIGSRAIKNGCADELREFIEAYHLPVATTMSAKGSIPENHPLSLGTFGNGGNHQANTALLRDDVDVLLLVGLDFNQNESLDWDARLHPDRRQIIRIDRLPRQFPATVNIDLELIVDDCAGCLQELTRRSHQQLQKLDRIIRQRLNWVSQIQAIPWHWEIAAETCLFDRCLPLDQLIRSLQSQMPAESILCADAGTTRIFAGHSWISNDANSFFASSQLAPMGWAIAAGIGIQLAHPDRRTIVLTGDGSMLMHGMEIVTAVRYQLPILFVICNNGGYGTIHQRFKTDIEMHDFTLLPAINWVQFAQSLGVAAIQVASSSELNQAIDLVLVDRRPFVLEVLTPLTHLTK